MDELRLTADEIIALFAPAFRLPLDDSSTPDRIMEILADNANPSQRDRNMLAEVAAHNPYRGSNPDVMLSLYDVLGDSPEALIYGIRGFEILARDPKKLIRLQNPTRLVGYAIESAEDVYELNALQDALLDEGRFYPSSYGQLSAKKHLAQSIILVASEIADRLRDFSFENATEDKRTLIDYYGIRRDAYRAMVMAWQGYEGVGKETLEALAAYESLTKTYQARGFTIELMQEYFNHKYSASAPSTGEIPEDLKAEQEGGWYNPFSGIDWDQHFREERFGVKESNRERQERLRGEAEREEQKRIGDLESLLRDPWSFYSKELELIGVRKGVTYQEAKTAFRRGIRKHRSAFTRMDVGTSEYDADMAGARNYLSAWERIEPLFRSAS